METFQDKYEEINQQIAKRRYTWHLKAVAWMDFDDVAQIIRIHINNKWHLWNQEQDFVRWVNKVITNQIINLLRSLYMNMAKPCIDCPLNEGDGKCRKFVVQSAECPFYAKWQKSQMHAYNVKLPVSMNYHTSEIYSIPGESSDLESKAEVLHRRMKDVLTDNQYKLYNYLYIQGLEEEEVARLVGYKNVSDNKNPSYRHFKNMKKLFMTKATKIINEELS